MIGYKVVRKSRNRDFYYSAGWGMDRSPCHIYRIGEATTRRKDHGPMALFGSAKSARKFVHDYPWLGVCHIFRCDYEPSHEKSLYFPLDFTKDCRSTTYKPDLPVGTRFADSVTLLEEVK